MNFISNIVITIIIVFSFLVSSCNRHQHADQQKAVSQEVTAEKTQEEKLADAIKNNPEAFAENPKFQEAIVEAIKKDPMLLFQDMNLNKVQNGRISKIMKKANFTKIAFEPNPKSNPRFTKCVEDIKNLLTPMQNGKFDEILTKLN